MRTFFVWLLAACCPPAAALAADGFPTKAIQLVVGFAPGGPTDILARELASSMSRTLGQQVVVVNRPGAGSNIAAEIVARGNPDGYTLLMGSSSNAVNVTLYSKLNFHFPREFTPINSIATAPLVLIVSPSVQAQNVKDLVTLLKSKPGVLNYASGGHGSSMHLAAEVFRAGTGVSIVHVPYSGAAPAILALLGGQVQFMFSPIPNAVPFAKQGKVRMLAVSTSNRTRLLPDLPTMIEAGVPHYDVSPWWGLFAPAKTPAPVVASLSRAVEATIDDSDYRKQLDALGAEPLVSTPARFSKYVVDEVVRWRQVVKDSGAKVD